jgi:hypothetical protein
MRARAPLRTFEPLRTIIDTDERPKTSRGPQDEPKPENGLEDVAEEEAEQEIEDDGEATPRASTSTNQAGRPSRFIEGSMNERSYGIASSWYQDGSADPEKPLPPTPAGKHVTFSCTPVRECLDDQGLRQAQPTAVTKKKERRGLRRSMSNFNFQAISEKMKIFGSSTHDVSETTERKKGPKPGAEVDILNDRKRKADEAYAAQFGFKKQRFAAPSNSTAPAPTIGGHTRTAHQEAHHSRGTRLPAAASFIHHQLPRKKSRRELEKENAELRARLAQHGPIPASTQENFVRGQAVMVSPGKGRGKLKEDVPPVPQIPGRGALKVLEDGKRNSRTSFEQRIGQELGKEKRAEGTMAGEHWKWPDDVF